MAEDYDALLEEHLATRRRYADINGDEPAAQVWEEPDSEPEAPQPQETARRHKAKRKRGAKPAPPPQPQLSRRQQVREMPAGVSAH